MATHTITLIPGDGIGPEITTAMRRVVEATGVDIAWDVVEAGEGVMAEYGTPLPEHVLESTTPEPGDYERLVFPLVQIPLELARDQSPTSPVPPPLFWSKRWNGTTGGCWRAAPSAADFRASMPTRRSFCCPCSGSSFCKNEPKSEDWPGSACWPCPRKPAAGNGSGSARPSSTSPPASPRANAGQKSISQDVTASLNI